MSMISKLSPISIWESPRHAAKELPRRTGWLRVACETEMLALLERSLEAGETLHAGYQRVERELATLFATLSLPDARELHRRLCKPAGDDEFAARFGRFVQDRRQRLIGVLADAPRRAALAGRSATR